MKLDEAKRVLASLPAEHEWVQAVETLIRQRRNEALATLKAPPRVLPADDRQFASGEFNALDELGAELQQLVRSGKLVKAPPE
jgi:hypothetical protein